ncbi:MAG: ABC transporter permease, partial [Gemmatimonadetes bacterium]|nr:ABC transporter permease [Gemmatimonadota bacterium]
MDRGPIAWLGGGRGPNTSNIPRTVSGDPAVPDFAGDIRFALRSLRRAPLHSVATVLMLGAGSGAVTLMFSVLNASVLRPLPFPEPDRLVWLWKARDEVPQNSLSYDDFRDYRESLDALADLGAYQVFYPRPLLSGTEAGTRVRGNQVTPNLFSVLGVAPALGRTFRWEEAVDGGPDVVILSHAFWQGRMGADPGIVGRTLSLDGRPTEVVGVMPAGFAFPSTDVEIWLPTREGDGATQGRGNNNFFAVGRLEAGVSLEAAQAQVDVVARGIQEANPDYAAWRHWLQPLHTVLFGEMRTVLLLLLGVVALVPLVACANVASLALARAATRTCELATRRALGASRGRVVGQLVVENVILALLGGVLGVAIAQAGGSLLRSVGPSSIPRLNEIGVDSTVLSFALLASLMTVPLFGVGPAMRSAEFDLAGALRFGSGRGGAERRGWARSALVVTQVALSMTLLVTSALFYRSLTAIHDVDPGFDLDGLLTARVQLPEYKYASAEELGLAWDLMLRRIAVIPGVAGVAAADWLPVTPGGGPWNGLSRPGQGGDDARGEVPGRRKFVNADYFQTLGIPLRRGRPFQEDDTPGSGPVMILSETLASQLFSGEDPLGQPVQLWGQPFQVVGVSARVDEAGLGDEGLPAFFVSADQFPQGALRVALRTSGEDPLAVAGAVRSALREEDPDITLTDVQTMDARIDGTLAQPRVRTGIVAAFALVGLTLAAVGLYGVLAYLVALRRHEIGIRMAVGADAGAVLRLVMSEGMR